MSEFDAARKLLARGTRFASRSPDMREGNGEVARLVRTCEALAAEVIGKESAIGVRESPALGGRFGFIAEAFDKRGIPLFASGPVSTPNGEDFIKQSRTEALKNLRDLLVRAKKETDT